jgi:hypothetical protein
VMRARPARMRGFGVLNERGPAVPKRGRRHPQAREVTSCLQWIMAGNATATRPN